MVADPLGLAGFDEYTGAQSRFITSKQRPARLLLLNEGNMRSAFVDSISWNQLGASALVGSVIKRIIGIKPAWKRKYLPPRCEC